ncbi:hypothetical protein JTB14_019040 [Gonioctena quinquepunctata]|nr:hypothetical protein JTB14_019040 [Gonioctena quinquepunctata]
MVSPIKLNGRTKSGMGGRAEIILQILNFAEVYQLKRLESKQRNVFDGRNRIELHHEPKGIYHARKAEGKPMGEKRS